MTIYITDFGDDNFIYYFLPTIIYNKLLENLNDKYNVRMNEYLNEKYSLSLKEIVELVKNNLNITSVMNKFVIAVDKNIIEPKSKLKLITLINLIDYGNLEVKGINYFEKVFKEIKYNFREIYQIYQIKKENLINGN